MLFKHTLEVNGWREAILVRTEREKASWRLKDEMMNTTDSFNTITLHYIVAPRGPHQSYVYMCVCVFGFSLSSPPLYALCRLDIGACSEMLCNARPSDRLHFFVFSLWGVRWDEVWAHFILGCDHCFVLYKRTTLCVSLLSSSLEACTHALPIIEYCIFFSIYFLC